MEKRTQIIYIKPANSSFIRGDQQVLEKKYDVKSFLMNQDKNKAFFGYKLIELFFFLLLNSFRKNVVFVSWFADYHSARCSSLRISPCSWIALTRSPR
jgi:hypothetical protein